MVIGDKRRILIADVYDLAEGLPLSGPLPLIWVDLLIIRDTTKHSSYLL